MSNIIHIFNKLFTVDIHNRNLPDTSHMLKHFLFLESVTQYLRHLQ